MVVAALVVVGGLSGYLWRYGTTGSNVSRDAFAISSFTLLFGTPGCDCDNLSLAVNNRGATPITGVNISGGHRFLGLSWSSSFPVNVGESISGSGENVPPAWLNSSSDSFSVTAYFADGNATTVRYLWPEGTSTVLQVQTYCCRDSSLNSSCTLGDPPELARVRALVLANPAFVELEGGKVFAETLETCSREYGVSYIEFGFVNPTPQYTNCGDIINGPIDVIDVKVLLTPTGYSVPSMTLQETGNSMINYGSTCISTTTISTSTA
jgi:hypothetical protein